jgi:hypothetical protein
MFKKSYYDLFLTRPPENLAGSWQPLKKKKIIVNTKDLHLYRPMTRPAFQPGLAVTRSRLYHPWRRKKPVLESKHQLPVRSSFISGELKTGEGGGWEGGSKRYVCLERSYDPQMIPTEESVHRNRTLS